MPSRIIQESCRTSPTLNELSDFAERLFWRLTTVADDFGRFPADARYLRSECFPLRDDLKSAKVAHAFQELIGAGLVVQYREGERTYGQFKTWEKYQRRRAETSKYPAPTSDNICGHPLANAAVNENENGIENENERRRTGGGDPDGSPNGWKPLFTEFWNFWTYRTAKAQAETTFRKLHQAGTLPPLDTLRTAVEWQTASGCLLPGKSRDGRDTRPHPSTWLNDRRWEDERPPTHESSADEARRRIREVMGEPSKCAS